MKLITYLDRVVDQKFAVLASKPPWDDQIKWRIDFFEEVCITLRVGEEEVNI